MRRLATALVVTSSVAACGGSSPAPPVVTPPPTAVTINGTERIGWDQPAADAVELATIGYAIYLDGTRTEAGGVTCASTASAAGFACTARLPSMSPGAHSLQVAAFVNDGGLLESTRSAALPVTLVATTDARVATAPRDATAPRATSLADDSTGRSTSASAAARRADVGTVDISDGFRDPTALAWTPDGRLFVAERAGTIAVIGPMIVAGSEAASGTPSTANAASSRAARVERSPLGVRASFDAGGTIVALAIDPAFVRTHVVFAIYTERDPDAAFTYTLARFRESGGTLADAAVLLDRVPAASPPHAALATAGDGTVYAAFDAADDASQGQEQSSLSGRVIHLNPDGTTPRDQTSPVVAGDVHAPIALVWSVAGHTLWLVDQRGGKGSTVVREVGANSAGYLLPGAVTASAAGAIPREPSAADLLIAVDRPGELLRVKFAANGQPLATERLARDEASAIHALAAAPDGAIYAATASSIVRLDLVR